MLPLLLTALTITVPPEPRVLPAALVYTLPAAADLASTEIALAEGLREANPLMRRRVGRLAIKAAMVYGLTRWDVSRQRSGKSTKVMRVTYVVGNAALVAWNVKQIRERRQRWD